ncbi:MAG: bacterial transcriptional activator domain-containing protein [Cyanobacteria bacterium P01_F01_bin.150]
MTQRIRAALERAIRCYQGDLLPDYEDEWVVLEREQLRQMQSRALEQLIALLEKQQDYTTALRYAQQFLQIDRLNEAAYCTLMRLHGVNGDRANALQTYHQCMTLLQDELGIVPSAHTRTLYEQLLHEDEAAPQPSSHSSRSVSPPLIASPQLLMSNEGGSTQVSSLVGRKAERKTLLRWTETVLPTVLSMDNSDGRDQGKTTIRKPMLLLTGEPGIFKI